MSNTTCEQRSPADIAYQHAVEVCERLVAELNKELKACTTQENSARA